MIPRRAQMLKWCEAEKAIGKAMEEVEKMGADIRLTDAVIQLGAAKDSVADYIDGIDKRRFVADQTLQEIREKTIEECAHTLEGMLVIGIGPRSNR